MLMILLVIFINSFAIKDIFVASIFACNFLYIVNVWIRKSIFMLQSLSFPLIFLPLLLA